MSADAIGDYRLEGELGRGGMGTVFRAVHAPTGARRALKVIRTDGDPELIARFRREAEALARVAGEGIVPVHEIGVARGVVFLAMGLMPGGSLGERLKARGRFEWRDAARIVATLARSLERCHAAGIVHRDVKPDNVLFDEEDRPRLADFGLVSDASARSLTETGTVLGTPAYMAPEQLAGERVDARADIYALGAILHTLVTGERPHGASTPYDLLRQKLSERRSALPAGTPAALEALVAKTLAASPAARPQTAGELARSLEALLDVKQATSSRVLGAVALAALIALAALAALAASAARRPPATSGPVSLPPPPPPPPPPAEDLELARKKLAEAAKILEGKASWSLAVNALREARKAAPSGLPRGEVAAVVTAAQERLVELSKGTGIIPNENLYNTVEDGVAFVDAFAERSALGVRLRPDPQWITAIMACAKARKGERQAADPASWKHFLDIVEFLLDAAEQAPPESAGLVAAAVAGWCTEWRERGGDAAETRAVAERAWRLPSGPGRGAMLAKRAQFLAQVEDWERVAPAALEAFADPDVDEKNTFCVDWALDVLPDKHPPSAALLDRLVAARADSSTRVLRARFMKEHEADAEDVLLHGDQKTNDSAFSSAAHAVAKRPEAEVRAIARRLLLETGRWELAARVLESSRLPELRALARPRAETADEARALAARLAPPP